MREKLQEGDDKRAVGVKITKEELAFLEALRKQQKSVRELAYSLPEMPLEVLWMVGQVMKRSL